MTDFDFDTDKIPYASVAAKCENGFGHLVLSVTLPELRQQGTLGCIYLDLHSQCSAGDAGSAAEPFYGVDLYAVDNSTRGMARRNCVRAAKAMGRIDLAVAKLDEKVGSSAVLLEDKMFRLMLATKVQHVFVPMRVNQSGSILNYERFRIVNGIIQSGLRGQVMHLKHQLLTAVGQRKAA